MHTTPQDDVHQVREGGAFCGHLVYYTSQCVCLDYSLWSGGNTRHTVRAGWMDGWMDGWVDG